MARKRKAYHVSVPYAPTAKGKAAEEAAAPEVDGPYRSQSSVPSIRSKATAWEHRKVTPNGTVVVPTATPAAAVSPTSSSSPASAGGQAAAASHRAAARQQRLVDRFVNHAYERKVSAIKGSPNTPVWEVGDKVRKAKSEVDSLRERLLSHPAVKDANSEGKIVPVKGLQKLREREGQYHALDGPEGISHSKLFGLEAKALKQTPASRKELATTELGGKVARTANKAKIAHDLKGAPSTLEALGYASIGAPGIGVGGDLAKVVEVGAEAIPKLLTEGGARQIAKDGGERIAARAASVKGAAKAIPDALRTAPKAARGIPDVLKAGARETPAALKAGAKAAPKYAGEKALQGGEKSLQAFSGAGALGALHQGGVNLPGGAILEGQAKAFEKDPGKVLSSTANLAPGLLVSAFQIPAAAGASIATGSPEPLKEALEEQVNFFHHFADIYGSNDAKKIEKATLEEGFLPEVLVGPATAKGAEKLGAPLRDRAGEIAAARRAPATGAEGHVLLHEHGGAVKRGRQRVPAKPGEKPKLTRQGEINQHRREEAFHASNMNDTIQLEHAMRREGIDKYARKAAGERTPVREGLGKKGKDTLYQRPPDYLPFLARAGIDLHNPEAALREIRHYAEKYKGLDHPAKYGVNPEALTARDAVKFFIDHPEYLKDKNLAKALDEFRAIQNGEKGLRSLSISDRNRYLGHAVMHGIPDAVDRVPLGARKHTDATTREGAWEDVKARAKQVEALRKEGRKKYDQAQVLGKDSATAIRLREEAKAAYDKARVIEKGRKELHAELKDFTRPGAKPNPAAVRTAYDAALEKEMADEARASLKAKGLHPEPAYVPDTDAINRATPDQSATGGQKPLPGGPKINEGFNWRHGLTRQGYEHMMNEAILRQVARNHQFADWRRFRADRGIEFEGAHQHYGKDWARAFDQGVMNRRDVALVPTQVVNRLEKATQGGDPTEYEEALAALQASRKLSPDDAQKGTIYEAYPKAAYEEKVQQAQKTNVPTWLRKANRYTGMNMLSTPAFLGMQVVAETAQAIASVNPARMIQGLRAYNRMPLEARLRMSGIAGETAKAIFSPEDLQTTLGSHDDKPFTDALGFFRRNVFGRTAKSFVTLHAVGELDRLKGSPLRRAVITGQIMRDLNGAWAKGRKLLHLQTEIQKKLDGKTPAEQLQWITEHPKVLDEYGKQLHDNMGGWGNLTRTGHVPESARAAALVFYPFLRMSLQWPLKYALNHPVKATVLAYLAAQNNWALKEALHGEPSFLNYAQVPIYGVGKNGQPVTINLARAGIGANAPIQAIQGSGSVLGILQPVLAAGVEGATGKGPLGSVDGGVPQHLLAAGASILGLSPYVRAGDTLRGQKASGQSAYGILGKRANIATEPLAALESKLKGAKSEQLLRSLALPTLPQDIEKQRDYAHLGKILGKLGKYGSDAQSKVQATSRADEPKVRRRVIAMQRKYDEAHGELEALYKKHGLGEVAKRSEEIYFYTHPYPGSEEKTEGIYGKGSLYQKGSIYESSGGIYGGGNKEKPPPFPEQSDGIKIPGLPDFGSPKLGSIGNVLGSLIGGDKAQAATVKGQKPKAKVPRIEGFEHQDQKEFAQWFAHYSNLPPKLADEWVKQEGGGYSNGGEAGPQNWLGVRYPAEPTPFSQTHFNGTPKQAAKNTVLWMEGKLGKGTADEAASSIQQIIPLARSGASEAQVRAYIEGPSAWGTGAIAQSGITASGTTTAAPSKQTLHVQRLAKAIKRSPVVRKGATGTIRHSGGSLVIQETSDGPANVSKGVEPQIAARLLMLSKKTGKPVYVISGARTPQHSVEVGGFANDPHTEGKAMDIGVGAPTLASAAAIPESVYESVGLHRPYFPDSAAEGNHVELLEGAPGTVTVEGGSASAPSVSIPGVGAVMSASAASTSTSPTTKKGKVRQPKMTAAQRLRMVEEIASGDLKRFGIPGFSPKVGPSVEDLAAIGEALSDQRRKLLAA